MITLSADYSIFLLSVFGPFALSCVIFIPSCATREPELPLAPGKKKQEVGEGLVTENGDGLLLMGVPRGSLMMRWVEMVLIGVSEGGRSVEIGSALEIEGIESPASEREPPKKP